MGFGRPDMGPWWRNALVYGDQHTRLVEGKMKLRHKASGVVLEGEFTVGASTHSFLSDYSLYDDHEWERVPEERWVKAHDLRIVFDKYGYYEIQRKECC